MSIDINGELYRSPVSKSEIYSNEEHTQQIEATVKNNYQAFPTTHISPHRITDDK